MNGSRLILLLAVGASALAQRTELLWPDGAPGAVGNQDEDRPTLGIYLPPADKASGAGVVICPGGGYAHLSMDKEGSEIAAWLNDRGLAGFVLKYRLGPRYHHPAPLDDAHRAIAMFGSTRLTCASSRTASGSGDSRRADTWPQPPPPISTRARGRIS
jgi:acetyl esterase/lipase